MKWNSDHRLIKKQYDVIKKMCHHRSYWHPKVLLKLFFFPLSPVKVFRSISAIVMLAALIALGLILSFVSISIPGFGISLGFSYLASMMIGWFYGPIYGLIMGATIDTIAFLMNGGVWFWLYAIQEPLIGFIAGIIGGCFRISQKHRSIKWDFIIFEIIFNLFIIITYVLMLVYVNDHNLGYNQMVNSDKISIFFASTYKWILLAILLAFYLVIQVVVSLRFKKDFHKNNYQKISIFMYSAIVCIISTCLFSFILGPISAVEYFVYLNGRKPTSLLKYGLSYYLIPRVIKEAIKTPIYILLYASLIMLVRPIMQRLVMKTKNAW